MTNGTFKDAHEFRAVEDIPVMRIRYGGRQWRVRIFAGRLFQGGEQVSAIVDCVDGTLTISERCLYQTPLRTFLGCLPTGTKRRRIA